MRAFLNSADTKRTHHLVKSFSAAVHSYDSVAHAQKTAALILCKMLEAHGAFQNLEHISHARAPHILDVGTGTGDMAKNVLSYCPKAHFTLNDISSAMLKKAMDHHKAAVPLLGNIDTLTLGHFDMITSNLCLQWSAHFERTLEKMMQSAPIIAFSALIQPSFQTWYALMQRHGYQGPLLRYPSKEFMHHTLQTLKGCVSGTWHSRTLTVPIVCKNGREALFYFKKLGAVLPRASSSISALRQLVRATPSPVTLHYEVYCAVWQVSKP